MKINKIILPVLILAVVAGCAFFPCRTADYKTILKEIPKDAHHLEHFKVFAGFSSGYNLYVLRAIDTVQKHALDGGTYFIGVKAVPPECPVNYELKFGAYPLLAPTRSSSYCSGSSYAAFIEALSMILKDSASLPSPERLEAMRMQEPDGGRRDDWVKFWGIWNADGFGSQYAMQQYAKMGVEVKPKDAIPGDFVNISWKTGNGHSVVFLGWHVNEKGQKCMLYWSSQKSTNGYGDCEADIKSINCVKFVRLTNPANIYLFNINEKVDRKIPGDMIDWE